MKGTVFITGATSGFGEATARLLARNGYKLILAARRQDRLKALANELGSENVYTITLDVCDKFGVFDAIKNIPIKFKDIEILVNNAGLALGQDNFIDASLDDFEKMIDTNVKGLIYITKAILPIMKERKSGYVFNLGSVAGNWPYPGSNVYGATKAFVKQLSFNLRNDLKGTNIRVTNIEPGIAKTEFSLVRFKGDKARAESVYENTEYLRAEDIAMIMLNCINMPSRANINSVEVMATTQTWAGLFVEKTNV